MKHLVMVLAMILLPTACIDPDSRTDYNGPYYGRSGCERFTSCSTCTPILGCGWCSMGTKGICVDQPNRCGAVSQFTWTWELALCPASGDAGTGGPEAGPSNDGGVQGEVNTSADANASSDGSAD